MKEDFPVFLWKYQYFPKQPLTTHTNETLAIINGGVQNNNAGPDFLNAAIIIDGIHWRGNVEVHVRSSDWFAHKHNYDPMYHQVILHVVWENNRVIYRPDGTAIPTLELKSLVDIGLIDRYKALAFSLEQMPCHYALNELDLILVASMLEKAAIIRLKRKARNIIEKVQKGMTWEEITYQTLVINYGFNVNQAPFLRLSKLVPLKLLQKHGDNILHIEALFFGMAGLLEGEAGEYKRQLRVEFNFLKHKYQLKTNEMNGFEWKFLRMRPANFPTIRIAQLSMLYYHHKNLFSTINRLNSRKQLVHFFSHKQSDFWQQHYRFEKQSKFKVSGLGDRSIDSLIINAIVPLKIAYKLSNDENGNLTSILDLMESLAAEENKLTRIWKDYEIDAKNALQSQGMIELFKHFCLKKKCLNCNIGIALLRTV